MGKTLSVFDQARLLRARFPHARIRAHRERGRRVLRAHLVLRPGEFCGEYLVEIAYVFGIEPHVWVQRPRPVKSAHGEATPHLNPDGTLCLFDPHGGEWSPSDSIADTTVAWASLWLMYYELWLDTGEWKGGGAPMPEVVIPTPRQPASEIDV